MTNRRRDSNGYVEPGLSRFDEPLDQRGEPDRPGNMLVVLLAGLIAVLLVLLIGGGVWLLIGGGRGAGSLGDAALRQGLGGQRTGTAAPGDVTLDLAAIKTAGGNTVSPGSNGSVIVASREQSPSPLGTTGGAYIKLEPAVSQELSGHTVIIRITARAASQAPTSRFAAALSGNGLGDTGWVTFVPTDDFQTYALRVSLPAAVGPTDHIGIWADVFGLGKALEISKIEIVAG